MDITTQKDGLAFVMRIRGRLDATWAEHLAAEIDEAIRAGNNDIVLDLHDVNYISSAGIRVLLQFHKQLSDVKGTLSVARPSGSVKKVIDLSGLTRLLHADGPPRQAAGEEGQRRIETDIATFDVYTDDSSAPLECRAVGTGGGLTETEEWAPEPLAFDDSVMAVGIGSLADDADTCREWQGEFLAVAGAAAYLPPSDTAIPDYMLASRSYVPTMQVRHAVVTTGAYPYFVRFEQRPDTGGIAISELAKTAFELTGTDRIGMVLMAESAGLIGASLRRPPAGTREEAFAFPGIRSWLSFSSEPLFDRSLTLVAGVALRSTDAKHDIMELCRPLTPDGDIMGHLHACAFSFGPLPRGKLELGETTMAVFGEQTLQGLLHLVNDSREPDGGGESLFRRGVMWVGGLA